MKYGNRVDSVGKMAALVRRCIHSHFVKYFKTSTTFVRFKSDAHIAMTDDSSTIVCWHPETHFPYEKSLPIPEKVVMKSDSILKIQSNKEFLNMIKPKREEVVIKELTALTYTTKHAWYPKGKRFRRKPPIAPDRPYL